MRAPALSLAGLARPYLDGTELVADLSGGLDPAAGPEQPGTALDPGAALEPAQGDPPAPRVRRWRTTPEVWLQAVTGAGSRAGGTGQPPGTPALPPGPASLILLPLGTGPRRLSLQTCERVLAALPDGAHAVLLPSQPLADLPVRLILDLLSRQHCLLLQVAELRDNRWPAGLVLTRTGGSPALPELNEYLLASAALQALQARVAELGATAVTATGPTGSRAPGGEAPPGAGGDDAADRDRLARALRSTQRQLAAAYHELAMLESSATFAAGRAIVSVARHPLQGSARLPSELYRLWRERRDRPRAAAASAGALMAAQDRGAAGIGDRWLAAYTAPGYPGPGGDAERGLVIAGVLTAAGCATLEPDALAHPLLPHNADFVLEGTGADLVLIQASALLPGSAWAYAADPAAADRSRRLAGLLGLARSLGKPVVLLQDAPWAPPGALQWLAACCDAVVDGDLGVQLARFNPLGPAAGRPPDPVYAGARDPREPPALRQVLAELGDGGRGLIRITGHVPWRAAPDLYRRHAVFLAATAAQARQQLAAGARVIAPPGETAVSGAVCAPDVARVAGELKSARDAGAPGQADLIPVLREIFTGHATPVRLAGLARAAGLPDRPLPGRQVAVLAQLGDPAESGRLAAGLRAQHLAPAEVVISLASAPVGHRGQAEAERTVRAAFRPLAATGAAIRVTVQPGIAGAAAAARSPWAVPWPSGRELPPDYLLDLVCARECGRADAVGWGGTGAALAFAPLLSPALARRELLTPAAPPPASWPARGLRTVSITPGEAAA